ncbi:hypothetical protein IVB25_16925 [Bradyrhizobium sp. 193]|uniref:hypothetical protein n=1 Tax=Bradyrhizobium sp. 193 TaxID=2782661 RepID=UPI001FFBD914|nr:hypothetical protein [Bradyrhizobium sp. 193]MCK1484334.1 hypothetical protein [Bradyrhizobium sp. 193]
MVIHGADAQHGAPAIGGAPHLSCCKIEQWLRRRAAIGGRANRYWNDRSQTSGAQKMICSSKDR